jgi:hypothetical protein
MGLGPSVEMSSQIMSLSQVYSLTTTFLAWPPGARSDGIGGFTVPYTINASLAITSGGKKFAIDSRDLAFARVDKKNLTGDYFSGSLTVNWRAQNYGSWEIHS